MHSTLVALVALTISSFLPCATALPQAPPRAGRPTATSQTTLPVNGGGSELVAPTGELQYIGLGRGVQNYSCSAAGAVPVAIGAVASLFDATSIPDDESQAALEALPPKALNVAFDPKATKLSFPGFSESIIGHHFFTAAGVPTFDQRLQGSSDIFFGKKNASIPAPTTAVAGSVPWLQLLDAGGSDGVSEAYRLVTAGGSAPATCPDTNVISVQYSALYYFFNSLP